MTIFSRVNTLIKQHQTRQQLRHLPDYLIQDIGKTKKEINKELSKNSLLHFMKRYFTSSTRSLLKVVNEKVNKQSLFNKSLTKGRLIKKF